MYEVIVDPRGGFSSAIAFLNSRVTLNEEDHRLNGQRMIVVNTSNGTQTMNHSAHLILNWFPSLFTLCAQQQNHQQYGDKIDRSFPITSNAKDEAAFILLRHRVDQLPFEPRDFPKAWGRA